MRLLPTPALSRATVYFDCVAGVAGAELSSRLNVANDSVDAASEQYALHAENKQLHMLIPCAWGGGDQVALTNIKKSEFVALYDDQMSNAKGSGRSHYDKLRLTRLGICPFCGFGHVSTLDHFAAKSRYPAFSVLPINLVPSCSDCNKGKGSGLITVETEMPHPYFEDSRIETDGWLICDVIETLPVTVVYRTDFPADWDNLLSRRVLNYFNELKLASRYAVQAASYLAGAKEFLASLSAEELRWYISKKANSYEYKNEWEAALYAGLAQSEWFIQAVCRG
ncbi:MAG: HNH endonuclease [Achromobacter sp.]|uniref:HNH endonuclease n=1 Tax=Achromobacter sp. TaxID=134375 RepID=UPI003D045FD0